MKILSANLKDAHNAVESRGANWKINYQVAFSVSSSANMCICLQVDMNKVSKNVCTDYSGYSEQDGVLEKLLFFWMVLKLLEQLILLLNSHFVFYKFHR